MDPETAAVFARDWKRVEALPDGTEKERLKDDLKGMRVILEILEALPPNDPFLNRCEAIARRIQAGPPAEDVDEIRAELAACVEIARSKMN
jgi:hypothetical protein